MENTPAVHTTIHIPTRPAPAANPAATLAPTLVLALVLAVAVLLLTATPALARSVYVSDVYEITLRTGPSTQYKVLAKLTSGDRLRVLEESEGWLKVTTPEDKEGWVIKRYTTESVPALLRLPRMEKNHERMAAKLKEAQEQAKTLADENAQLKATLNTANSEMTTVKQDFAALKSDAAGVIALRKRAETAEASLTEVRTTADRLATENKELRASDSRRWFLIGAGVVAGSWLIGFIFGRLRRKPKSSLTL
jgi:SH3 domain protein